MINVQMGYDIDGVLAEFSDHFLNFFDFEDKSDPDSWDDPRFRENFHWTNDNYEFWSTIPPIVKPSELTIPPYCYITSRSIPSEWSMEWLWRNGFPYAKLITVGVGQSKIEAAKSLGCTHFIDDHLKNFDELNEAGVACFLKTRGHNVHRETDMRVDSLDELQNAIIRYHKQPNEGAMV